MHVKLRTFWTIIRNSIQFNVESNTIYNLVFESRESIQDTNWTELSNVSETDRLSKSRQSKIQAHDQFCTRQTDFRVGI